MLRGVGSLLLMITSAQVGASVLERSGGDSNLSGRSGIERSWKRATGGTLSRVQKNQLGFLDAQGALLGVATYDELGRLRRTMTRSDPATHFTTEVIYPVQSTEAQTLSRFDPKTGNLIRKVVAAREAPLAPVLDPLSALECEAPSVLTAQPELQRLYRLLDPPASPRPLACEEPDASGAGTTVRNYTETGFGMYFEDSCATGPDSGGVTASAIQQAMTEAVDEGIACLARQGVNGIDLAVRLAGVLNQGGSAESPGCSSPRPMRIQCQNDPCDSNLAVGTTTSTSPEFPRVRINMARIPRLYQCSGRAGFKAAFFHEFLHNTGVRHGEGTDYCYAAAACCFPEGEAERSAGGYRTADGVAAACRLLARTSSDATERPYLQDFRAALEAQGRPSHFATTVAFTLARGAASPEARAGGGWARLILEQSLQALAMGDPVFALGLASAQLARLSASDSLRGEFESVIAQARTAGATDDQARREGLAMLGEAIAAAQQGRIRDAAAVMTRPANRAGWTHLAAEYGRALSAGASPPRECPTRDARDGANRSASRLYLATGFLRQVAADSDITATQRRTLRELSESFASAASSGTGASCSR